MNTDDPDFDSDPTMANAELMGYAYNMAEERRRCPADDIVTRLVQADMDGREAMGDVEFAFFVILLAVAGNETTRNAMTHGMNAFFEQPRSVGAVQARAARRPPSTRSSAGPPRCTASSAPHWPTSNSAA